MFFEELFDALRVSFSAWERMVLSVYKRASRRAAVDMADPKTFQPYKAYLKFLSLQ